jgi:hypothetical protein
VPTAELDNLSAPLDVSRETPSTFADTVFPVMFIPAPAVISPAPENCVNVTPFVPMIVEGFETTQPLDAFVVPVSTNTNDPAAFDPDPMSSVLTGAPLDETMYKPFSVAEV